MVILIMGASHTGKTTLAKKLLEKYKYPYFSIDHLKMGLIRSGLAQLTPTDDEKLTEFLWPVLREMIKTVIENEQNLIVEGCYIPWNWTSDFAPKYRQHLQSYCLIMSENYIRNHFDDIQKYAKTEKTPTRRLFSGKSLERKQALSGKGSKIPSKFYFHR